MANISQTRTVEVSVSPCDVQVLIKGLPHLLLRRSVIVGVQAYIQRARTPIYVIEFSTTTVEISSDYDDRDLWEAILRGLLAARLFDKDMGESPR